MLKITKAGSEVRVGIQLNAPRVYVDYGGLADLAEQESAGERFREALLAKGGTLYLSLAHLLEMYGLGPGHTYGRLKTFLSSFGCQFAIMDCDVEAVIKREAKWRSGQQNSSLDVVFLEVMLEENWHGQEPFSIGVLLATIDSNPALLSLFKEQHHCLRQAMYQILFDARDKYQTDSGVKKRLDEAIYEHVPETPPTTYLRNQLRRETIRTHEPLKKSNGLDYLHAVVALAYCNHVVLDKKWAARVQRFPTPSPMARVWKIGELTSLTEKLSLAI